MSAEEINIYEFERDDRVRDFFIKHWGAEFIVSGEKKIYGKDLSGFAVLKEDKFIGLLTYHIKKDVCEIVSFDSLDENKGIGTRLIEAMIKKAEKEGFSRLWLMTTNDNVDAMRFYQRRGFVFKAVYPDTIKKSRELKQDIPEKGFYNIPIRDEVEFEFPL